MTKQTTIIISSEIHSRSVPVSINGEPVERIPVGEPTPVSAEVLAVLDNSNINYEIVGSAASPDGSGASSTGAGKGPGGAAPAPKTDDTERAKNDAPGTSGNAPTAQDEDPDLALLDQSIPNVIAAIEGFHPDRLKALRKAEKAGKTRKGVLDHLDGLLAS